MINVLMLKTPLYDRMVRWAESGKAKSMPLHPQDYYTLSKAGLVEKMEEKFKLPIICLGGESGLAAFMKDRMRSQDDE